MVDRCVCSNILFSDLKKIIESKNLNTFEELKQNVSFGVSCALCVPYVKLIFSTGKTEFEPIQFTGNTE